MITSHVKVLGVASLYTVTKMQLLLLFICHEYGCIKYIMLYSIDICNNNYLVHEAQTILLMTDSVLTISPDSVLKT